MPDEVLKAEVKVPAESTKAPVEPKPAKVAKVTEAAKVAEPTAATQTEAAKTESPKSVALEPDSALSPTAPLRYLVAHDLIGHFEYGQEVTVNDLPEDSIPRLLSLGALIPLGA